MATPVPALERAHRIVALMAERPRTRFTMSELAELSGINRATCFSTVIALAELGVLHRDERHKSYALGPRLTALGDAAANQHDGLRPARVEMFRLSAELKVSGLICARMGDSMVVLDHVGGDRLPSRPRLTVGVADPIRPPLGTIFMAWEPPERVDAWLARAVPDATEQELLAYRDTLEMVRIRGYSLGADSEIQLETAAMLRKLADSDDDAEQHAITEAIGALLAQARTAPSDKSDSSPAVNYLIAPIFGPDGDVVLTITLWAAPGVLTMDSLDRYATPLLAATRQVTVAIGGRVPTPASRVNA